jgi:hypothetical protein
VHWVSAELNAVPAATHSRWMRGMPLGIVRARPVVVEAGSTERGGQAHGRTSPCKAEEQRWRNHRQREHCPSCLVCDDGGVRVRVQAERDHGRLHEPEQCRASARQVDAHLVQAAHREANRQHEQPTPDIRGGKKAPRGAGSTRTATP